MELVHAAERATPAAIDNHLDFVAIVRLALRDRDPELGF
jgi:hypothetical protein